MPKKVAMERKLLNALAVADSIQYCDPPLSVADMTVDCVRLCGAAS